MASAKTLYVYRPLLNGSELHRWAATQGFRSALPKSELHVTVAFSRETFNWSDLQRRGGNLRITGGKREIEKLGDAIVLRFTSRKLADRWQQICDAGASWDYPGYKPHVTISYIGAPQKISNIEPYDGVLVFGPERFDEVNEDANKDIDETKMADTKTQPNNTAVKFLGKPKTEPAMPVVSKSQNAAMHSAAEGKSKLGIPKKVGEEFTENQKPVDIKKLPQTAQGTRDKVNRLRKRGLISDKAASKMPAGMS